eukprot:GEMP01032456.1.p1 GENE.GEMP01032456.1~~GEMP01032456.1.p1  ORF type:complete len:624 (+),score=54.82 GEMP01032456.1:223-2094(+)
MCKYFRRDFFLKRIQLQTWRCITTSTRILVVAGYVIIPYSMILDSSVDVSSAVVRHKSLIRTSMPLVFSVFLLLDVYLVGRNMRDPLANTDGIRKFRKCGLLICLFYVFLCFTLTDAKNLDRWMTDKSHKMCHTSFPVLIPLLTLAVVCCRLSVKTTLMLVFAVFVTHFIAQYLLTRIPDSADIIIFEASCACLAFISLTVTAYRGELASRYLFSALMKKRLPNTKAGKPSVFDIILPLLRHERLLARRFLSGRMSLYFDDAIVEMAYLRRLASTIESSRLVDGTIVVGIIFVAGREILMYEDTSNTSDKIARVLRVVPTLTIVIAFMFVTNRLVCCSWRSAAVVAGCDSEIDLTKKTTITSLLVIAFSMVCVSFLTADIQLEYFGLKFSKGVTTCYPRLTLAVCFISYSCMLIRIRCHHALVLVVLSMCTYLTCYMLAAAEYDSSTTQFSEFWTISCLIPITVICSRKIEEAPPRDRIRRDSVDDDDDDNEPPSRRSSITSSVMRPDVDDVGRSPSPSRARKSRRATEADDEHNEDVVLPGDCSPCRPVRSHSRDTLEGSCSLSMPENKGFLVCEAEVAAGGPPSKTVGSPSNREPRDPRPQTEPIEGPSCASRVEDSNLKQ